MKAFLSVVYKDAILRHLAQQKYEKLFEENLLRWLFNGLNALKGIKNVLW